MLLINSSCMASTCFKDMRNLSKLAYARVGPRRHRCKRAVREFGYSQVMVHVVNEYEVNLNALNFLLVSACFSPMRCPLTSSEVA